MSLARFIETPEQAKAIEELAEMNIADENGRPVFNCNSLEKVVPLLKDPEKVKAFVAEKKSISDLRTECEQELIARKKEGCKNLQKDAGDWHDPIFKILASVNNPDQADLARKLLDLPCAKASCINLIVSSVKDNKDVRFKFDLTKALGEEGKIGDWTIAQIVSSADNLTAESVNVIARTFRNLVKIAGVKGEKLDFRNKTDFLPHSSGYREEMTASQARGRRNEVFGWVSTGDDFD